MTKEILIADDDTDVLTALSLFLERQKFAVTTVNNPAAALKLIEEHPFDLAILDLNYTLDTTSGVEGLDLIRNIRTRDTDLPIVVMTGWATVDTAVKAMQLGAQDFLEKPWENERLLSIANNLLALAESRNSHARLSAENKLLKSGLQPTAVWTTKSATMRSVLKVVERVAPTDVNVLISGPNGTGKGLLAQLIHDRSKRSASPLVSVNTSAVPETMFESEMFGHIKGAFTDAAEDRMGRFEIADTGTLFLDEIGNIPLTQQAKLLRVLEAGEFERLGSSRTRRCDVRIVAATNADLEELVERDQFRRDLLYRLNAVQIQMPTLGERIEDIADLARHFLKLHSAKYARPGEFSPDAITAMQRHTWPGNVRELSHVVERAVLMSDGPIIAVGDLQLLNVRNGKPGPTHDLTLEEAERNLVEQTMLECDGNAREAATKLGLSRSALYRRLEKYGS